MSFKILNKEGQAIIINMLDKEAAEFWNQKVGDDYAVPLPMSHFGEGREALVDFIKQSNWFDMIGYNISQQPIKSTSGWDNVKCNMFSVHACSIILQKTKEEKIGYFEYIIETHLKPYFDLIDFWASKEYTPVQITD